MTLVVSGKEIVCMLLEIMPVEPLAPRECSKSLTHITVCNSNLAAKSGKAHGRSKTQVSDNIRQYE